MLERTKTEKDMEARKCNVPNIVLFYCPPSLLLFYSSTLLFLFFSPPPPTILPIPDLPDPLDPLDPLNGSHTIPSAHLDRKGPVLISTDQGGFFIMVMNECYFLDARNHDMNVSSVEVFGGSTRRNG